MEDRNVRDAGPRIEIDPALLQGIREFQKEHMGSLTAAGNALILRGLNDWRREKPQTTPKE